MSKTDEVSKILDSYGLKVASDAVMTSILSKDEFSKSDIDKKALLNYVINEADKNDFIVSTPNKLWRAISKLSFSLGELRDEFKDKFLADKSLDGSKDNTIRGREDEDAFANKLAGMGVYITYIGNDLPTISDTKSLIECLKSNSDKISISVTDLNNFYMNFGEELVENPELEGLIANNISDSLFYGYRGNSSPYKEKGEILKEIEEKYGIKVCSVDCSYKINSSKRKQLDDIISGIKSGKIKIMITDLEKLKQPRRTKFKKELENEINQLISDREKALEKCREALAPIPKPLSGESIEINELNGEDVRKDREMSDKLLKALYIKYGKDVTMTTVKRFATQEKDSLKMRVGGAEHEFVGEKKPLKAINCNYIEHILKNAKDIENNHNMNPKARKLINTIIAMYSTLKLQKKDDKEIYDILNNALTELIVDDKRDRFDAINKALEDEKVMKIAEKSDIDLEDLKFRMSGLDFITKEDAIDIIMSSEIDKNIVADPLLKKSDLEESLDRYTHKNDCMQIAVSNCIKTVNASYDKMSSADKSSIKANMQASKNNLLMTIIRKKEEAKKNSEPDPYPGVNIDSKKPVWEQLSAVESFIVDSTRKYSQLKSEIATLRETIVNKRIAGNSVENDELMLNQLLNEYENVMKIENNGNMITKYITITKSQEIVGKYKETSVSDKSKKDEDREP